MTASNGDIPDNKGTKKSQPATSPTVQLNTPPVEDPTSMVQDRDPDPVSDKDPDSAPSTPPSTPLPSQEDPSSIAAADTTPPPAAPTENIPGEDDEARSEDSFSNDPEAPDTIPAPFDFDPLIGTLVDGRYLLNDVLGRGGMGSVYKATHVLMDKPVAIKLIHAELAHLPNVAKRFEREAQSASRLSDPHCITVTDFGRTDDGKLFLVMEILKGPSLSQRIEEGGAIPVETAVHFARQILKGLLHAHNAGVVHRDLKPENVMLVTHGDQHDFIKLLDFGIAKLATGGPAKDKLTQGDVVFGTPGYLSPEQALGDPVDHRADLYACGVILYELLTGELPFRGETAMSVISQHLTAPLPKLSKTRQYPAKLQKVIDRAMAKKPEERFESAQQFIEALDAICPEPARPLTDSARMAKVKGDGTGQSTTESAVIVGQLGEPRALIARLNQLLRTRPARAGLAGLALLVFVVIIVALSQRTTPELPPPEPEVAATDAPPVHTAPQVKNERRASASPAPAKTPVVTAADPIDLIDAQLRNGLPAEAVVTAKELLNQNDQDAKAHLLLGHAQFLSGDRAVAMEAYHRALQLDESLKEDVRFKEHLIEGLKWATSRYQASVLLGRYGGDPGLALLASRAGSARVSGVERRTAREALIEIGHRDKIDFLASLTADFNEFTTCKKRRQIIAQMMETRNPGFLPLLENYKPPVGKKRKRRWARANQCIFADVVKAIRLLTDIRDGVPEESSGSLEESSGDAAP